MDAPFDQTNIGLRERPVSADFNQLQSQLYRTMRELVRTAHGGRAGITSPAMQSKAGFFGDGLRVVPASPTAMSVVVSSGIGFTFDAADIPSDIGSPDLESVDDLSAFKPSPLVTPVTFAVPAAPSSGNSRIDIIEIRNDRRLENSVPRRQLDVASRSYLDHNFYKTLAYALDGRTGIVTSPASSTAGLSYKIGAPGSPGVAPATTTGYTKIAEINVLDTTTTIDGSCLVDRRPLLAPGGVATASIAFRIEWNSGAPIVTVREMCAPPGMFLAVDVKRHNSGIAQSNAWVHLFGGEIQTQTASAHGFGNDDFGPLTVACRRIVEPIYNWTSAAQAGIAFLYPTTAIGIGTKAAIADVAWWEMVAGVLDNTTLNAKDATITVDFKVRY